MSEPINQTPLYSVGTWDVDEQAYTPQDGVACVNLDIRGLRAALKQLRKCGYTAHRVRVRGDHYSDTSVLVERTDGEPLSETLERWRR